MLNVTRCRPSCVHTRSIVAGRLSGGWRLGLRVGRVYGGNPGGEVGISHDVDYASGQVRRMMHVGDRTLVENGGRVEGRDSAAAGYRMDYGGVPGAAALGYASCRL